MKTKSTLREAPRGAMGALLTALLALLLSSCPLVLEGGESGLVILRISDGGAYGGRTVQNAAPSVTGYELWGAFSGQGQTLLASYASLIGAEIALEPGSWDFTLRAFDGGGGRVLEGKVDGFIVAPTSGAIIFILTTLTENTGRVILNLSWPVGPEVSSYEAIIDGSLAEAVPVVGTSLSYSNPVFPSGNHILVLNLFDASSALVASIPELIWVRDNLLSQATIILDEGDFNSPPAAPSNLVATCIPGLEETARVDLSWIDSSDNETGFVLQLEDGSPVGSTGGAMESFSELTAPRGQVRRYQILARNSFGDSAPTLAAASLPIPILATFVYQDGLRPNLTVESGPDFRIAAPSIPSRIGYDFEGWYDAPVGGIPWDFGSPSATNRSLYAHWAPLPYFITYFLDGGSNHPGNPASYSIESPTITLEAPTKPDYFFNGWFRDPGFTQPCPEILSGSTGDLELYAFWLPPSPISATTSLPEPGPLSISGALTIPYGSALNLTAEGAFTTYQWYLDGAALPGQIWPSLSLNSGDFTVGVHSIMVLAGDASGIQSSARVSVRFTQ